MGMKECCDICDMSITPKNAGFNKRVRSVEVEIKDLNLILKISAVQPAAAFVETICIDCIQNYIAIHNPRPVKGGN